MSIEIDHTPYTNWWSLNRANPIVVKWEIDTHRINEASFDSACWSLFEDLLSLLTTVHECDSVSFTINGQSDNKMNGTHPSRVVAQGSSTLVPELWRKAEHTAKIDGDPQAHSDTAVSIAIRIQGTLLVLQKGNSACGVGHFCLSMSIMSSVLCTRHCRVTSTFYSSDIVSSIGPRVLYRITHYCVLNSFVGDRSTSYIISVKRLRGWEAENLMLFPLWKIHHPADVVYRMYVMYVSCSWEYYSAHLDVPTNHRRQSIVNEKSRQITRFLYRLWCENVKEKESKPASIWKQSFLRMKLV